MHRLGQRFVSSPRLEPEIATFRRLSTVKIVLNCGASGLGVKVNCLFEVLRKRQSVSSLVVVFSRSAPRPRKVLHQRCAQQSEALALPSDQILHVMLSIRQDSSLNELSRPEPY